MLSRRDFVKGSGMTVAAAAVALGPRSLIDAAAAAGRGLSTARRRTYAALVTTLGKKGVGQIDGARAGEATSEFERWYGSLPAENQRSIDEILDVLESDTGATPFSSRSDTERYEYLRKTVGAAADHVSERDARGHTFDEHLEFERRRVERIVANLSDEDRRRLDLDPDEGYLQTFEMPPEPGYETKRAVFPGPNSAAGRRRQAASAALMLANKPFEPEFEVPGAPSPVSL